MTLEEINYKKYLYEAAYGGDVDQVAEMARSIATEAEIRDYLRANPLDYTMGENREKLFSMGVYEYIKSSDAVSHSSHYLQDKEKIGDNYYEAVDNILYECQKKNLPIAVPPKDFLSIAKFICKHKMQLHITNLDLIVSERVCLELKLIAASRNEPLQKLVDVCDALYEKKLLEPIVKSNKIKNASKL